MNSLHELLLPDPLHQLGDSRFGALKPQEFSILLILVIGYDISVELLDVKNGILICWLGHREELNVNVQLREVLGALFGHLLLSLGAWVVVICKQKDSLGEALLLD